MAERAEVVFVDGVRTPFGRAGEKGMYWNTRADDLVVKAIDRTARAQPERPEGPHRRRRDRGHHADRRPGPDPRPHRRDPRRAAEDRSRLRDRPHVRRRDDRRRRRWRDRSASACTTSPSPAASSTWATTRWVRAPTRTRASSPRSSSAPDALNMGVDRRAHPRPLPAADQGARRPLRHASQQKAAGRVRGRQDPARPRPGRHHGRRGRLGPRHRGRGHASRDHDGGPRRR